MNTRTPSSFATRRTARLAVAVALLLPTGRGLAGDEVWSLVVEVSGAPVCGPDPPQDGDLVWEWRARERARRRAERRGQPTEAPDPPPDSPFPLGAHVTLVLAKHRYTCVIRDATGTCRFDHLPIADTFEVSVRAVGHAWETHGGGAPGGDRVERFDLDCASDAVEICVHCDD